MDELFSLRNHALYDRALERALTSTSAGDETARLAAAVERQIFRNFRAFLRHMRATACKHAHVRTIRRQLRANDEAMTLQRVCEECGKIVIE